MIYRQIEKKKVRRVIDINDDTVLSYVVFFETGKLDLYAELCLMHYFWSISAPRRFYRPYIDKLNRYGAIGEHGVNVKQYYAYLIAEMSDVEKRTGHDFNLNHNSQLIQIFNYIINKQQTNEQLNVKL